MTSSVRTSETLFHCAYNLENLQVSYSELLPPCVGSDPIKCGGEHWQGHLSNFPSHSTKTIELFPQEFSSLCMNSARVAYCLERYQHICIASFDASDELERLACLCSVRVHCLSQTLRFDHLSVPAIRRIGCNNTSYRRD